ncbi:MAG TPA: S8 family serine peptidase [Gammaproteobacteria bacterium]|nr:S8 family serine peptidase [Gammaproteobacteria bacterium]
MASRLIFLAIAVSLILLASEARAVRLRDHARRPIVVPGEVLVKYRAAANPETIDQSLRRLGLDEQPIPPGGKPALILLGKDQPLKPVLQSLRQNPAVEYAERIYYRYPQAVHRTIPADPLFPQQWAWDNPGTDTGSVADADVDMPEAWGILHDAPDIKVAIIDDGFDLTHPDLEDNFVASGGVSCIKGVCGGGTTAQLKDADKEFHGTLVAGVIGAVANNRRGGVGAVWHLDMLPLRTDLRSDSLAAAVRYAVDHNADIINISLGGAGQTNDEKDALDYALRHGVLVFAAAGNLDSNIDYSVLEYPANYDLPNIIAVAASDKQDHIAYFSQWGSFAVDLAAPGVDFLTTSADDGFAYAGGTSFSTPTAAGVAALVAQRLKDQTGVTPDYRAVKAHLLAGAEDADDNSEGPLFGRTAAGRVNAYQSLQDVSGGVLVVTNVTIDDDPALSAANDDDGQIDPGETIDLDITLVNDWQSENDVRATLVSKNSYATAATAEQDFGAMVTGGADVTATADFPVTIGDFSGNQHLLFELDISTASGKSIKRYFYLNVGVLHNNETVTQTMQRTDWDEFQAYHVTVPTGARDLVIYTHTPNNIDIDLLARYGAHPEYDISLGTDPENDDYTFFTDSDPDHPEDHTKVSGNQNGDEGVGFAEDTKAGTYQIVAVNFAESKHSYQITACYAEPDVDQVSFTGVNTEIQEDDKAGVVKLSVTRSGTTGAATIDYATEGDSALAGVNYKKTSGTLEWADGDNATRTITIPIMNSGTIDNFISSFKRFHVVLSNPSVTTIGCVDDTMVTLTGTARTTTEEPPTPAPPPSPTPPPSSSSSGGGAFGFPILLILVLALRRRGDHRL